MPVTVPTDTFTCWSTAAAGIVTKLPDSALFEGKATTPPLLSTVAVASTDTFC